MKKTDFTDKQLHQILLQVAHSLPVDSLVDAAKDMTSRYAKIALAEAGSRELNEAEIVEHILKRLHVRFDPDEIKVGLTSLVDRGDAVCRQGLYSLAPKAAEKHATAVAQAIAQEKEVFDEWAIEIRSRYTALDDDDVHELIEEMKKICIQVFREHGAEVTHLFYPERDEASAILDGLKTGAFREISVGIVNKIGLEINLEIYRFFANLTDKRKHYIAESLDAAFFIFLTSVDHHCSEVFSWASEGTIIYVDTNFIYRVLDLQGPGPYKMAKKVLELGKSIGFSFFASDRTVKELMTSLKHARDQLKAHPVLPADLAEIAAAASTDHDFITAYWKMYRDTNISVDDFYAYYSGIPELLEEQQIAIKKDVTKMLEGGSEAQEEFSGLYGFLHGSRHTALIEHDALHIALILQERGDIHRAIDAKVWFLTCDKRLADYDRRANRDGVKTCLNINECLQLIRLFVPRTEDFEEAFAQSMSEPSMRVVGAMPAATASQILGRLAIFRDYSPALAIKLLMDEVFVRSVQNCGSQVKAEIIIDDMIMSEAKRAAENEVKRTKEIKRATNQLEQKASEIEDHQQRSAKEQIELARLRKQLADEQESRRTLNQVLEKTNLQIDDLNEQVARTRKIGRLTKAIAGLFVALLGLLTITGALFSMEPNTWYEKTIALIFGGGLIIAASWLNNKSRWISGAWRVGLIIMTIFAGVITIITSWEPFVVTLVNW